MVLVAFWGGCPGGSSGGGGGGDVSDVTQDGVENDASVNDIGLEVTEDATTDSAIDGVAETTPDAMLDNSEDFEDQGPVVPECHNGEWESDLYEFCDESDPTNNGCGLDWCTDTCDGCAAYCGNGVVDDGSQGEECDSGIDGDSCVVDGEVCTYDCQCVSMCGNNVAETDGSYQEICDGWDIGSCIPITQSCNAGCNGCEDAGCPMTITPASDATYSCEGGAIPLDAACLDGTRLWTFEGNSLLTDAASTISGPASCIDDGDPVADGSEWHVAFAAPVEGLYEFTVVNIGGDADFDSLLYLYNGCDPAYQPFSCNDDIGDSNMLSQDLVWLETGDDVRVVIDFRAGDIALPYTVDLEVRYYHQLDVGDTCGDGIRAHCDERNGEFCVDVSDETPELVCQDLGAFIPWIDSATATNFSLIAQPDVESTCGFPSDHAAHQVTLSLSGSWATGDLTAWGFLNSHAGRHTGIPFDWTAPSSFISPDEFGDWTVTFDACFEEGTLDATDGCGGDGCGAYHIFVFDDLALRVSVEDVLSIPLFEYFPDPDNPDVIWAGGLRSNMSTFSFDIPE